MIRLAMIGCGGISQTHRARFDQLEARLKVTATVDIEAERAREAAQVVGAEHAFTDYREALPYADAVLIALPHHLHHPVGMECLAAGKHVLMEKPLANSERQCLDLIESAEQQGVILMVAYNMRFHPLTIRMKELIDEKRCGETFHVSIRTEQFTRYANDWAHKIATLGGGQFFSHGCHYVDILLYYLGNPVSGTHLGTNLGTPWMEREGTSDMIIKFESGAMGYHGGTWGAKGTRLGYAFHAQGTEGMLEADFRKGRLSLLRSGKEEEVLLETESSSKYADREMAHFLDCIEKNQRPLTDGPRSLQGLRVIWRMYAAEDQQTLADLRGLGQEQPWR